MFLKLRRSPWRTVFACLALASTVWGAWLTVVHGTLADDAACAGEFPAQHRSRGLTLADGSGAIAPQHCYICHWLRSLRSLVADTRDLPSLVQSWEPLRFAVTTRTGQGAVLQTPARSPPA
jgi:hypothetical protein